MPSLHCIKEDSQNKGLRRETLKQRETDHKHHKVDFHGAFDSRLEEEQGQTKLLSLHVVCSSVVFFHF